MPHRRRAAAVVVLLALAGLAAGVVPVGAGQTYQRYVALGDSYASGPLIPTQSLNPVGCLRSNHNYPSDLERQLGVPTFVDVSCGGATTDDMTAAQSVPLGSNPPQFDALTPGTDLVTLTIGGNDLGFTSILQTCAELSLTDPLGNPCQRHYTAGGTDQLAAGVAAVAPKIAAALAGIHRLSPRAHVVLVGYLRILPPTVGCWPVMPVAAGDVPYLDGVEHNLNRMLGTEAAAHGATSVNPGGTTGHDVCQLPGVKWVEGVVPTAPAFPVHPNEAGMAHVAALVRAAV